MTYLEAYMMKHPYETTDDVIRFRCPMNWYPNFKPIADCKSSYCSQCWNQECPEDDTIEGKFTYATKLSDGETLSNLAGETVVYVKEPLTEDDVIGPPTESIDDIAARELEKLKPRILDSGERREFASGAVRDIQEGKGRCDLLPLDVVGLMLNHLVGDRRSFEIFDAIYKFQTTGEHRWLFDAIISFIDISSFLNAHTMLLEVSKHFEEGAKKYGEDNWQKGIDVHCYIDSAVRHYLKFLRGDQDEPHDRAFCWNILCAIWTCKHKPELNEYAERKEFII